MSNDAELLVKSIAPGLGEIRRFLRKKCKFSDKTINFYSYSYKQYYGNDLRRLAAANKSSSKRKIRRLQDNIGNSMMAARNAIVVELYLRETNPKKTQGAKFKVTANEIEELAKQVKYFSKVNELIVHGVITKQDGSKRPIITYGPIRNARARIAADFVTIGGGVNEYEYSRKGFSTHKAVADISEYIKTGYKYWAYLDIKDAFPSVRRSHLSEMAVVSKHTITTLVPTMSNNKYTTLSKAIQPSLPQGIAASPKIMSTFVGQQFQCLTGMKVVYMSYVDDLLIGARTMGELKVATETLKKRYENYKAGSLHFKIIRTVNVNYSNQVLNYVGYAISVDHFTKEVRVRPNIISFQKLYDRLLDCMEEAHIFGIDIEDAAVTCAERWKASYIMWNFTSGAKDCFDAMVNERLDEFKMAGYSKAMVLAIRCHNEKLGLKMG